MPQNILDEHKDRRDLSYVLYPFVTPLLCLYVQVENICTVFNNICLSKTTKVRIESLERESFQFLFTISDDSDFKTQLFNLQVFSLCCSTFLTSIKTQIQFTELDTLTNSPYFLIVWIRFFCWVDHPPYKLWLQF